MNRFSIISKIFMIEAKKDMVAVYSVQFFTVSCLIGICPLIGFKLCTYFWINNDIKDSDIVLSVDTCHNRCNAAHDASKICQCNSACLRFNDCCSDYTALCAGGTTVAPSSATCQSLAAVSNELWANDVNRLSGADITVNYQTQVADGTTSDRSSGKFFTHVNEAKLSTGTYKLLSDLFNNYDPTKGNRETATTQELNENNAFLDAILATKVMTSLLKFLQCKGIVHSQSELKTTLKKLWFDFYSRSGTGTTPDTSGFEHMMVGEYKDGNTVNGFHNWVSFYEKEKAGTLNYFGYVKKANPEIVGAAFSWANHVKTMGSFFIGVSPEFEIAVYSLCFLTNPGKACQISLNNIPVTIMSYSKDGHIATAYASERKIHVTVAPSGNGSDITTEQNVQSSSHIADSPIHKTNRSKKRKNSKRKKKKVVIQLLTPHKVDELANHRNSSGFEPDHAKIRNGKVQTKKKLEQVQGTKSNVTESWNQTTAIVSNIASTASGQSSGNESTSRSLHRQHD